MCHVLYRSSVLSLSMFCIYSSISLIVCQILYVCQTDFVIYRTCISFQFGYLFLDILVFLFPGKFGSLEYACPSRCSNIIFVFSRLHCCFPIFEGRCAFVLQLPRATASILLVKQWNFLVVYAMRNCSLEFGDAFWIELFVAGKGTDPHQSMILLWLLFTHQWNHWNSKSCQIVRTRQDKKGRTSLFSCSDDNKLREIFFACQHSFLLSFFKPLSFGSFFLLIKFKLIVFIYLHTMHVSICYFILHLCIG